MNIVLVGFMASGKSAVGRRLAKRLGYKLLDMDQALEESAGVPVATIFAEKGEAAFRRMETEWLDSLTQVDNHVFSTGGGILTTPGNMERLKRLGPVVFLNADLDDILLRLANDTRRPLVQRLRESGQDLRTSLQALLEQRLPLYMQADIVIPTLGKTPNTVAGELIGAISRYLSQQAQQVGAKP